MRNIFLIILLFFCINNLYSQDSSKFEIGMRIAPLSILNPFTSCIQIGLQSTLMNQISIGFDYGLYIKEIDINSSRLDNHNFYKLRGEIKCFLNNINNEKRKQYYFAMELFYIPQSFTLTDSWYIKDAVDYKFSYAQVKRNQFGLLCKAGMEKRLFKHFLIDSYFGLGFRNISNKFTVYDAVEYRTNHEGYFFITDKKEGSYSIFHLQIGVKICYVLKVFK